LSYRPIRGHASAVQANSIH